VTISSIVSNFWDMRINDLAVRLHFKTENNTRAQTANAIVSITINLILGLFIAGSSILACLLFWNYFTETIPQTSWLAFQGIISGCGLIIGTVYTLQRLTENFFIFGTWKLIAQLASLFLTMIYLNISPNIDGYYNGLLSSTLVSLSIATCILIKEWNNKFTLTFSAKDLVEALKNYYKEIGFIFSANFFSYSKMLSRSGDILLFGYFANDSATGIYRLAKTLSDNLSIFTDALSQYYTPNYMKRMSIGEQHRMKLSAKRLFIFALYMTIIIIPTSYISINLINTYILNNLYPNLDITTAIMMSNFIWFCGVHIWLWPSILHHNQMKKAAAYSAIAAFVQLSLIAIFCYYFSPAPWLAAIASVIFYIMFYSPLLYWWKFKIRNEPLPLMS